MGEEFYRAVTFSICVMNLTFVGLVVNTTLTANVIDRLTNVVSNLMSLLL